MTMLHIPCLGQPASVPLFPAAAAPPRFAEEQHCRLLINCYAREVAMQEHTLAVLPAAYVGGLATVLNSYRGLVLDIALPRVNTRLCVGVRHVSSTANYDYTTAVLIRRAQGEWLEEGWEAVARLIIEDLSARANSEFNDELLQQIGDSIATMNDVMQQQRPAAPPALDREAPLHAYIRSEQSLITGHPFHPAPKSRSDWTPEEQRHYSPEHQAQLTLRYFQVPHSWIVSDCVDGHCVHGLLAQLSGHGLNAGDGGAVVPLHPWQADWLTQQPPIAQALRSGQLRDLGTHGQSFHPTASIRTLLSEDAGCFLKLSLNMRITNCIRNNARHELESALAGTRLYRAAKGDMQRRFPTFHVLEERAFLTVQLPGDSGAAHQEMENGFGLMVREGLGSLLRLGVSPLICAALFGNGEQGRQHVATLIERFAYHHGYQLEHAARLWFASYAQAAVHPILYLLFEKGIAFEPHMQNTIIGLSPAGLPSHVVLRDLELTRLAPRAHAKARELALGESTLAQLCCTDDRAWTRIGYCLFVNNLCEVIATISNGSHVRYLMLWGVLRETLQTYLKLYPNPEASRRIRGLLAGEPLPAKGNLLTRFSRQADRHASYLPLYHPLGVVNGAPFVQ